MRSRLAGWFCLLAGGLFLVSPGVVIAQDIDELAVRMESSDVQTRIEAARDLGRMTSDEAVEVLVGAAGDPDRRVREAVLDALVATRTPASAPGLLRFLGSEREADREKAVRGLVHMHAATARPGAGTRAVNWLLRREEDFVLDPLRPVALEVVGGLIGRLQDQEEDVRRLAAEGLGLLRVAAAVPALAVAALDEDDGVSETAVGALGEVGRVAPDAAGPALLRLLDEPRLSIRAVEALGVMAFESAGGRLLQLYDEDPGGDLGKASLWALARIGYRGAMGTFIAELTSGDRSRRESAAAGLGRIGDPAMADGMIRDFLREGDRRVQLAYCFALVLLGEAPFVDRLVLELSDPRFGDQAREYALELGEPLVPEFTGYLDDPDRDTRFRLVVLLERIGAVSAIPALEQRSEDPDVEVADRARLAVRRLHQLEDAGAAPSAERPGPESAPVEAARKR